MKLAISQRNDTFKLVVSNNSYGYELDFKPTDIRKFLISHVEPHIPADWYTTIKQLHEAEIAAIAARIEFMRSIKTTFRDSIAPPLVAEFKSIYPELFI